MKKTTWPLGMIVPVQDPTPFSPFSPPDWPAALKEVARAGYQVVELAITDPTLVDPQKVERELVAAGLRLSSLTTGQAAGKEGLSLASPDEKVRRRAIERLQAHMALAAPHQAVVIVGLLRGASGDPEVLVESLQECTRFSQEVKLALEPLNRRESRLVNTVHQALEVLERVGAENLGLLLDTYHVHLEEGRWEEAFRAAGDRLFHLHLADDERQVPGYGKLPFPRLVEALQEMGYQGALVLESLPKPSPQAMLEFPRLAAQVLYGNGS